MHQLRRQLAIVRDRQQWQWSLHCTAWGFLAGGISGCLLAALWYFEALNSSAVIFCVMTLVGAPLLGFLLSWLFGRSLQSAAMAIDQTYSSHDRATTALSFLSRGYLAPIHELQIEDANRYLQSIDPVHVVPGRIPPLFPAGLGVSLLAVGLMWLAQPEPVIQASPVVNDTVSAQAERLEEELKELEEFQAEEKDEQLAELLKQLAAKLEELKQPGVDAREAMAKLSEMQSAIEAQQQALASPDIDAALQSAGEALTLAEPFQGAGQALSKGEYDKAAEQLEKQELQEIGKQTQKSLTEKLQQLQQQSRDSSRRSLEQSLGQIAEGLSQGSKSKFSDGMKGLAGEARKQSQRKKLADLLRKQCQCLSECKGECESECKNPGESKKKGGSKAGLARSGNESGEKTPLLKSPREMKITGQESAKGDSEVETSDAPEQEQQSARTYQQKLDKYQQLSESVLDSEPIPLGHRQTIRRYFDSIRPQNAEMDAVIEKSGK